MPQISRRRSSPPDLGERPGERAVPPQPGLRATDTADGDESTVGQQEQKETGRVEAFSDGVFAIAITLLVLNLRVPLPGEIPNGQSLGAMLGQAWPSYFAYVTSFLTILIMWINHHMLFRLIARTTHAFLLLNGLLLLFVTLVPFPTDLLAQYIERDGGLLAALIYAGNMVMTALAFNLLWRYASTGHHLLAKGVDPRAVKDISSAYRYGPVFYLAAFIGAFVNVWLSVGVCFALAVFFALPRRLPGTGKAGD